MLDTYLDSSALKEKTQLWGAVKTRSSPSDAGLSARRLAVAPPAGGSYHYGEQIHPWIQASIVAADAKRRQGEDLLVLVGRVGLAGGRQVARSSQERLRSGHRERWQNPRRLRDPRSRPGGITGLFPLAPLLRSGNRRELTTLVLDLWDKTHALSDLLEPENGTDLTRLPDIQRRAEDAQEGFPGTGGSVSKTCREPGEHPTRARLGSGGRRRRGRVPR